MRRKIYGKIKFLLQSDWIKKNAKSGAARNEEYYGKVTDMIKYVSHCGKVDMTLERF